MQKAVAKGSTKSTYGDQPWLSLTGARLVHAQQRAVYSTLWSEAAPVACSSEISGASREPAALTVVAPGLRGDRCDCYERRGSRRAAVGC